MKNLILILFIGLAGCSPKAKVISHEKSTHEKHNFQKVDIAYYFLENDVWVAGTPDEIPDPQMSPEFTMAMFKNMKYPAMARENGVQGTVILSIVRNELGQVTDSSIKKDLREGCGEAALSALRFAAQQHFLPPLYKDGVARTVKMDMPVKFSFE